MFSRGRIVVPALASRLNNIKFAVASKRSYHNYLANHAPSVSKLSLTSIQRYCSQKSNNMTVDFDYVKAATTNKNVLIVDVREPDEIKEHGKIPNSINIPLGTVTTALNLLSEQEFEKTYQRPKPDDDTEIIFYCMIGKRSGMAQDNAQKLGYKNTKNYLGSFTDWAVKTKS